MTNITSIGNSIWQGEVWLKIYFKIKIGKTFLSPRKYYTFMFHPGIEDVNTWVMYESDYDKFKLKFTRDVVIVCNRSKDLVMMDPYNSLKVNIRKGCSCIRRRIHAGSWWLTWGTFWKLRNHVDYLSNNIVSVKHYMPF